jgi:predicted transcriptional regulator
VSFFPPFLGTLSSACEPLLTLSHDAAQTWSNDFCISLTQKVVLSEHNGRDAERFQRDGIVASRTFVSSRHRSAPDATCDVLDAIRHGIHTETALMTSTRLTRVQVDKSLSLLVNKKMITSPPSGGGYVITREGRSFIDYAMRGVIPPSFVLRISK